MKWSLKIVKIGRRNCFKASPKPTFHWNSDKIEFVISGNEAAGKRAWTPRNSWKPRNFRKKYRKRVHKMPDFVHRPIWGPVNCRYTHTRPHLLTPANVRAIRAKHVEKANKLVQSNDITWLQWSPNNLSYVCHGNKSSYKTHVCTTCDSHTQCLLSFYPNFYGGKKNRVI